jgi:hypothetical protein
MPYVIAHSLEGSRFGASPATRAIFVSSLVRPKTRGSRRLPETTQRDAFTRGLRFIYTRLIELHRAGLFAGAACFHAFRPYPR